MFRFLESHSYALRKVDASGSGRRLRDSRDDGDHVCVPRERAEAELEAWF